MTRKDDDFNVLMDELNARLPGIEKNELMRLAQEERDRVVMVEQDEIYRRFMEEHKRLDALKDANKDLLRGWGEALRLLELVGIMYSGRMAGSNRDIQTIVVRNGVVHHNLLKGDLRAEDHMSYYFEKNRYSSQTERTGISFVVDIDGWKNVALLDDRPYRVLHQYLWSENNHESYQRMLAQSFGNMQWKPVPMKTYGDSDTYDRVRRG